MFNGTHDYDVIIVGGRPAGSTLAARLGAAGVRVLLLERATLPSLPGASSPIIYASVMNLLDEIGADESDYARNTPKLRRLVNLTPDLNITLPIPTINGRDYGYAIDRARFDDALWRHAATYPTVTAWDGFSVTDLLWEGERVVGICGQGTDKVKRSLTAAVVIGADGRFSTVARKVNAQERDTHTDHPTSLLYAYWRGAQPHGGEAAAMAYGEGEGYGFLVMDSADDTVCVCIEGRADILESQGAAEARYLTLLQTAPPVWQRLQNAEMTTTVRGMKKVGNLYRQPGGDGWALVGDAYHQKDPIDGQGIYDAVYTAKLLAQSILRARSGEVSWSEALVAYDEAARAETYAMYRSTLDRVKNSLYVDMPDWVMQIANRSVLRWLMEDRLVQERMGLMLVRQIEPQNAVSAPLVLGALLRGPLRDLSRRLGEAIERA
jgi:flavin-dependent dehydrogenase